MATEVQFKIVADAAQAQGATKSIKAELREATNEAKELSRKFGDTSTEAVTAQKKVAALREEISDINQRINALNPEAKFTALGDLAQGVAGGFAAAQGAMALFGAESQNVEKALLKVQSAMAISEGLNSIRGLGDAFGNVKLVVGDAIKSLFTLKGALIATGVGAFAVAVGAIVANWEQFKKALVETFPSMQMVIDFFDNFKKIAMGSLKAVVEGFKVIGEAILKVFQGDFSGAIDAAKSFGARTSAAYNAGYLEQQKKEEQVILDAQKKAQDEKLKAEQEAAKKRLEEQKKAYEAALKAEEEYTRLRREMVQKQNDAYTVALQAHNQITEDIKANSNNKLLSFDAEAQAAIRKQREEDIKAQEKAEIDAYNLKVKLEEAKYNVAASAANALGSLGNLLIKDQKKAEQFQKTVALIQIAIDTARAISSALVTSNAPTPDNLATGGVAGVAKYAALAATILANAARAKQIVSGAGSSGSVSFSAAPLASSGGFSGGIGQASAPVNAFQRSTAGGSITNQEGEGANALNQIKVFVTENDISSTQQRVQSIRKKATLVQ